MKGFGKAEGKQKITEVVFSVKGAEIPNTCKYETNREDNYQAMKIDQMICRSH